MSDLIIIFEIRRYKTKKTKTKKKLHTSGKSRNIEIIYQLKIVLIFSKHILFASIAVCN